MFRGCLRETGFSILINELSLMSRYDFDGEEEDSSSADSLACQPLLPTRGRPMLSQGGGNPWRWQLCPYLPPPLPLQVRPLGPACWTLADLRLLALLSVEMPCPSHGAYFPPLRSHSLLQLRTAGKYPHLSHDIRAWLVTLPVNFPAPASWSPTQNE